MPVKNAYNKDPAKSSGSRAKPGKSTPEGQPVAGTEPETAEQRKARDMERGLERSLTRIPPG